MSTGLRPTPGTRAEHGKPDERTQRSVRLGKRWSEIYYAVKRGDYTWQEFCDGLDEEELTRGQLRDDNGGFAGRPPSFVPREFLLACQREQKRRFDLVFSKDVVAIAQSYVRLAQDETIPAEKRLKAMQYAMERVFGGIPKDVRVQTEQPWEQMLVNVVTDGDEAMPDHLARRYATYQERQGAGEEG